MCSIVVDAMGELWASPEACSWADHVSDLDDVDVDGGSGSGSGDGSRTSFDVARAFGDDPGSFGIGVLSSLDMASLCADELLTVLGMLERQTGWLASVTNQALVALHDASAAAHKVAERPASFRGSDEDWALTDPSWEREELRLVAQIGDYDARHRLDTAVALRDRLPATSAALAAGEISWRHADALTHETAGLDAEASHQVERTVLADPRRVTAAQFRRAAHTLAATLLAPNLAEQTALEKAEARFLTATRFGDGSGDISMQLTAEGFATVTTAINDLAAPTGPEDGRSAPQRRADALVDLCASHLSGTSFAGASSLAIGSARTSGRGLAQLVVHLPFAALPTPAELIARSEFRASTASRVQPSAGVSPSAAPDASTAPPETAAGRVANAYGRAGDEPVTLRGPDGHDEALDVASWERLSCDATIVRLITDPETGHVRALGRATRVPDARLRAAVEQRDDNRCTFPGCLRRHHLEAHHIKHWTRHNGRTDQDNLTMLCRRHHHAVHDAGWTLRREPDGQLRWQSPTGRRHSAPTSVWRPPADPAWIEQSRWPSASTPPPAPPAPAPPARAPGPPPAPPERAPDPPQAPSAPIPPPPAPDPPASSAPGTIPPPRCPDRPSGTG
jgi:hypothetical protein